MAVHEANAVQIKQDETMQADAVESKRAADARQGELKQALDEKEALARELASVRGKLAAARDEIALHIRRETAVPSEARGSGEWRMPGEGIEAGARRNKGKG